MTSAALDIITQAVRKQPKLECIDFGQAAFAGVLGAFAGGFAGSMVRNSRSFIAGMTLDLNAAGQTAAADRILYGIATSSLEGLATVGLAGNVIASNLPRAAAIYGGPEAVNALAQIRGIIYPIMTRIGF